MMGNLRINRERDPGKRGICDRTEGTKRGMEQIKIDKSVREWFQAKCRLEAAKREVTCAEVFVRNSASGLSKLLLPEDALVGEIYIFQTTNDDSVRVFLKERTWSGTDGEKKIPVPHVEVHKMKKR